MIIVTTPEVPGRRIVGVLGLVRGNTIRGRHVGHDFQAILRNMAGGEIKEYTKMMAEAREQALDRMRTEARSVGADAVVGVLRTAAEERYERFVLPEVERLADFWAQAGLTGSGRMGSGSVSSRTGYGTRRRRA